MEATRLETDALVPVRVPRRGQRCIGDYGLFIRSLMQVKRAAARLCAFQRRFRSQRG
jgi:hypothetical protein